MGLRGAARRDEAAYARVRDRLDPSMLQAPGAHEEEALEAALRGDVHADEALRFLGYYTEAGLAHALDAYGFTELLRERGLPRTRLVLEPVPDAQPRARLFAGDADGPLHLVLDLHAQRGRWLAAPGEVREVLAIEWLALRDPRRAYDARRPRLPGQDAPGLGLGWEVLQLLVQASRRLGLSAIVAWPDHYHNAVLYGRRFRYHDPLLEGRLRALVRDARGHPLAHASWAVEWGCLRDARSGAPLSWSSFRGEQVLPLDEPLRARYAGEAYRDAAKAEEESSRYAFDWARFRERLAEARAKGEPAP